MRMCLLCRTRRTKPELFRLRKDSDGSFSFDPTQKAEGRGAYLCREKTCIEKAVKKKRISEALAERLTEEIDRLG
ncbi:MAG: YlxR family protein [Lachnospiraceae bacterium]|nr:YlxR family protein [Lachnospiraceae bacterium]